MRRFLFVVTTLLLLFGSSSVLAQGSSRMQFGKPVEPLGGAVAFCKEMPSRCAPHRDVRVKLNQMKMLELMYVNARVNHEIKFQAEPPEVDIWQDRNFTVGDCEDYALLKRRRLIKLGWPPGALHLTIVRRKKDDTELHAILVASTDRGDFVLDIPGAHDTWRVRSWNPDEFAQLRMVWAANAKWYELQNKHVPVTVVGAK